MMKLRHNTVSAHRPTYWDHRCDGSSSHFISAAPVDGAGGSAMCWFVLARNNPGIWLLRPRAHTCVLPMISPSLARPLPPELAPFYPAA